MRVTMAALLIQATGSMTSLSGTILLIERPTITSDPVECATRAFESNFDVPRPAGELDLVLSSSEANQITVESQNSSTA